MVIKFVISGGHAPNMDDLTKLYAIVTRMVEVNDGKTHEVVIEKNKNVCKYGRFKKFLAPIQSVMDKTEIRRFELTFNPPYDEDIVVRYTVFYKNNSKKCTPLLFEYDSVLGNKRMGSSLLKHVFGKK